MKVAAQALAFLVAAVSCAVAADALPDNDPLALVRFLYERSLEQDRTRAPPPPDAAFLEPFTAELSKLWRNARGRPLPPDVPDGPILHTYFGMGALPGRPVVLKAIAEEKRTPSMAVVGVDLAVRDRERHVRVTLTPESGRWRIANIAYDDSADFVVWLKKRAGR